MLRRFNKCCTWCYRTEMTRPPVKQWGRRRSMIISLLRAEFTLSALINPLPSAGQLLLNPLVNMIAMQVCQCLALPLKSKSLNTDWWGKTNISEGSGASNRILPRPSGWAWHVVADRDVQSYVCGFGRLSHMSASTLTFDNSVGFNYTFLLRSFVLGLGE